MYKMCNYILTLIFNTFAFFTFLEIENIMAGILEFLLLLFLFCFSYQMTVCNPFKIIEHHILRPRVNLINLNYSNV